MDQQQERRIDVATRERIAVLETKMGTVLEQLEHLHACTESVKQTVWMATGGAVAAMGLFELFIRVVFRT